MEFALPGGWQHDVLAATAAPLRVSDAYAKAGRERYGLTSHTEAEFHLCLRETADPDIPLAARAYLDVTFFHPFTDGNARAALLTLVHVLPREGIVIPEVGSDVSGPPVTPMTGLVPPTLPFSSGYPDL
ncbi:Fic family protein [Streptomyces sp. NPDC102395]|uniref:Fic family protein n=1 Tax=Streptomyces sp. NPDC102395 TaxID=3366168 RepID=UPI003816902C